MQYLLVGNYGAGNVGDEALREYFLQRFPEITWRAVSAHPRGEELPRFPCGVRSFFSLRWMKTLKVLLKSDGMVLGGGTLFTDSESLKACVLWWVHVCFARIFRKRVIAAFQGIGPFRTSLGAWCAHSALRGARSISVRDAVSYDRVRKLGIKGDVVRSFDPVFSLVSPREEDPATQKTLIVLPRGGAIDTLRGLLRELLQSGRFERVRILSLQPGSRDERRSCERLRSSVAVPCTIAAIRTLCDLIAEIAGGSMVLTQRFHGGIVALALGKELQVLPQREGDKLDALAALVRETPAEGRRERLGALVQRGEEALRAAL